MEQQISFEEYNEKVVEYLEYLGYNHYIEEFEPIAVATSIMKTNVIFWSAGYSYRLAALVAFGLTWECQIIPSAKRMKVH